jgi:hypothetical protein
MFFSNILYEGGMLARCGDYEHAAQSGPDSRGKDTKVVTRYCSHTGDALQPDTLK